MSHLESFNTLPCKRIENTEHESAQLSNTFEGYSVNVVNGSKNAVPFYPMSQVQSWWNISYSLCIDNIIYIRGT